jgi:hypothetical protein
MTERAATTTPHEWECDNCGKRAVDGTGWRQVVFPAPGVNVHKLPIWMPTPGKRVTGCSAACWNALIDKVVELKGARKV